MRRTYNRGRDGFTLIELLVVIAIIAILIGLLVPAVQKVREAAARTQCESQLKQLALAVHTYHDQNKALPQNFGGNGNWNITGAQWSWVAMVLPYIEQGNLYTAANLGTRNALGQPTTPMNIQLNGINLVATPIPVLRCPSDPDSATRTYTDRADLGGQLVAVSNYKGVCGSNWAWGDSRWNNVVSPSGMPSTSNNGLEQGNGVLFRSMGTTYGGFMKKYTILSIQDGTSNTFMIGESLPQRCQWTGSWAYANNVTGTCAIYPNATTTTGAFFSPGDWPNCYSFHSAHNGGLNFAMADASVRFISETIDIPTYRALATIQGREAVSVPD